VSQKKFLLAILFLILSVGISVGQTRSLNARSAIERGNRSFAKEDYETALREYRSVRQDAGETYAQALYNIGVCHYELWRTAEAIGFYQRAIELRHGRYPRASYGLGVALEDQGRPGDAKKAYQQSIAASHGEYAPANYRLGLLLAGEGAYKAAANSFREAMAHPGEHVPASHNNLGVMLALMGRLSEAGPEFETALRQTGGLFDDAAYNLKLCRSLLSTSTKTQVTSLRVSRPIELPLK
jgi:tetratricopeptide (TPR) repeat protein